ncbi:MAG: HDOD domain-containing protein [Piscinibacter sp.]|uniref:protein kinase domain-containing protein n=1 Tax=Piscinibacter sp. TaxID=1903157 RepID=UPI003D15004E
MSAVLNAAPAQRLGRFELRRVLGKGAQASVWLGFDPRLEREVAVKVITAGADVDPQDITHWLQEARSVSRLTHPNIVPVFEADVQDGRPYLVFEFVPGRTLAEHLRARGSLPPPEALALMLGVLDALQTAHAAGVVHRDLKPSNILVDGGGRARVMDFGIAARLNDRRGPAGQGLVVGTPNYMSPEATRGASPTPAMDVFAAGLVLVEILAGQPLVRERDPYAAMRRIAEQDLALPTELPSTVDDPLRAVLRRAIARDPAQRYADASAFADALRQWMTPRAAENDAAAAANSGTLDFLLRRMRHKSDFPALSDSIARIQRIAASENESLASLSNEILKDVALTNKLLRLVNSAHFSHAGGGSISTVSRAVALIGFAGIRNMALSLVLLEHMHDKGHANQLKEEFLRALMAGSLAGEMCHVAREGEEAFIGAMFQNLGRLLTEYYFPEEARQIRSAVAASVRDASSLAAVVQAETAASIGVLGLSFEDLGLGIAKSWGLPDNLQRCMRRPDGEPPARVPDKTPERLRWLTLAANELTDTLLRTEGDPTARLASVAERHARAIGLSVREIQAATEQARQRLAQAAEAMNLQVAPHSPARRLLATVVVAPPAGSADADTLSPHSLQATVAAFEATRIDATLVEPPRESAAEVLAAGIADITNSMVESFKLNEVLRMILETMFRALGFRRIVFCLRDPKTETLTGRFGLGEGAESVAAQFKVPLRGGSDLFALVCAKGADTLISDATVASIEAKLPAWYRSGVKAPAFLLLPLMLKGAPFALIYADKAEPGGIALGEKELSLLRTLRNQAVMAFRQTSG